ncbi:hypothetical protein [Streptomyces pseudovenezuelae]|uniref:hypothetical protein n=1 Tax=Streptomyces pseudovenezuelae TaxID=67350 RepID=UPI00371B2D44
MPASTPTTTSAPTSRSLAQFAAGPAVLLLGLQATLYAAAALILLATLAMVSTPSIRALVPKAAQSQPASGDPVLR